MKLIFNLIVCLILTDVSSTFDIKEYPAPKKSRKLLSALADKIIEYFDLENKLLADKYFAIEDDNKELDQMSSRDSTNNCNSIDGLSSYFLKVYTNDENMTGPDLDNMIRYQIKGPPKDNFTEYRSKRHSCNRKKVRITFSAEKFYGFLYL